MNPVQNSWSIGILKLAYSQSFTSAAKADFFSSLTAGLKGVKFHDIIYRAFWYILYTLLL